MTDVILPVLNEVEALSAVLAGLPTGFAPLVVDNGSDDGSGDLAADLGARVVREPRRGFGAACYAGLVAATALAVVLGVVALLKARDVGFTDANPPSVDEDRLS